MTRHYSPHSPYTSARTERVDRPSHEPYTGADHPGYRQYADTAVGTGTYRAHTGHGQSWDSAPYGATELEDADYEDYEDYDAYAYATTLDTRWKWIAGVAGAVLLVAVICTVVILGGGDSGSVSATVDSSMQSPPPATAAPQDTSAPAPPPVASLAPETITTVTPTAPPSPTASATPGPAPSAVAPPPPPAATPRAITYTVTGNRQLIDFVTVIYTDQQGALQTDVNVTLPWSKTVVLDPGVELKSVTATSVGGQLNCAITDAAGTALVSQNNNSMIATCTQ
ncbi:hypothetical protein AU196_02530 [Mycobacterium sp. IS-1742]|uniref:hypothetical protein n=1 Tax=Mycobacterium sp. IS-1742 TaxID=1772285 RepID=UPI00074021B1|nr:hypothetical protein [Mycobacterium sp. IS-1742]KUI23892.1 hypothetical protein AU196_02530 [Mycobacterium sp. IS-1742]